MKERDTMAFEKLSADELAAEPEYVRVLKELSAGEGVKATVKKEGVGKATIKKRLKEAAEASAVRIKFHRTPPEIVVAEVVKK
jgi:hypothetical protein